MNAIEFVKTFGFIEAKNTLDDCIFLEAAFFNCLGFDICVSDLKQIVDAFELVERYGGLIGSKKYLKFLQASIDIGLYHGLDNVNYETEIPLIRDAIACVEQC